MLFKRQVEILKDMVGYTATITGNITDFMVGSGARTMYDAFSIEMETLYMLSRDNIQEGIEIGLMQSYDFVPKPAMKAYGTFRITFLEAMPTSITIPRGTKITSSREDTPVVYETLTDYLVPQGALSVLITAYCTEVGSIGNVPKGYMNVLPYSIYRADRVTNIEDILTGTEEATYESTKKLFKLFMESRGRATLKALEYGAMSVPEITGAYVDEKIGVSYIHCHDNNGNLSDDLKRKVEIALEDYRPAGIQIKVTPIIKYMMDVKLTIVVTDKSIISPTFDNKMKSFIRDYLNSFTANQDLILSEFIQNVMNFDDSSIYDCYFNDLSGNVIMDTSEILRAGDIDITYL